ncbi:hypothetical protein [Blastococcus brunescens]|uniref:Uncharacterized protein n=1 Tax=Blastococcus brunescens TaxID=1564165 RepID=A0ABZ1B6N4_9ACTN|nr:hypothetical protein [Blastococcus sp. BMG 8361]WRL66032.1 hypothetical protein U6N30_11075 [Blastococcus sp. BMG 8361]
MPGARRTCRHAQISSSLWHPSASRSTRRDSSARPRRAGFLDSSYRSSRAEQMRRRTPVIAAARMPAIAPGGVIAQASNTARSAELTASPSTRRLSAQARAARCTTTPAGPRPLRCGSTLMWTGPGGCCVSSHRASAVT